MPVSFNQIPANWRMPLYWVEVDPSMAGYPRSRLPSVLIGYMNPEGTAIPDVPVPIASQADARLLFGYGSQLDGMAEFFMKNNFAQELWGIPIVQPAAGVAATGGFTITAGATSAGTLPVYIGGRMVQVLVQVGEDPGVVANNIVAAINKDLSMPDMTFTDIIEHKFAAVSDRKVLVLQSRDPVGPERFGARLAADPHIQRVDQADHDRQHLVAWETF